MELLDGNMAHVHRFFFPGGSPKYGLSKVKLWAQNQVWHIKLTLSRDFLNMSLMESSNIKMVRGTGWRWSAAVRYSLAGL